MTKTKFLSTSVVVLVILNIALLAFMFFSNKGPKGMGHPGMGKQSADEFIKNKFKFSDDQMALFATSKEKHHKESEKVNEKLSALSSAYYLAHKDQSIQDSLWLGISDLNKDLYTINSNHFDEVSNICTDEQKPELDKFINSLIGPRHRPDKGQNKQRKRRK